MPLNPTYFSALPIIDYLYFLMVIYYHIAYTLANVLR